MKNQKKQKIIQLEKLVINNLYKISRKNHDKTNLSYNFSARKLVNWTNHLMLDDITVRIIDDKTSEGYFLFLGFVEEATDYNGSNIVKIFGMGGFCYDTEENIKTEYTIYSF